MTRFSFVHAADLHLDTPFEGLGATSPEVAAALREASLRAFDRLIDLALDVKAAFLVVAGDVYDGPERGLRAQLRFRRGLERLAAGGIRTFVVHGNHDPVEEGWSAVRIWPEGVHVFQSGEVELVPVVREGRRIATVHGVSYGRRAEKENLAARFRRGPEPGLHVGVLHCNAGGQEGHDPYAPCTTAELEEARLDYWALGHVHDRQVLLRGATWAAYPGNLQGRSFRRTERGEKGALLVHVDGAAVRDVEFRSLAPVVFEELIVDASAFSELGQIEGALLAAVEPNVRGAGREGLIVRARITGRTPLHRELQREAAALRESLADGSSGGSPWVHWAGLEIATAPPIDREGLVGRDDFLGEVLRRIGALGLDRDAVRNELRALDGELRTGALARWVGEADEGSLDALLACIEAEAIDRLGEES